MTVPSAWAVRKRLKDSSGVLVPWRLRVAVWYERAVYSFVFGTMAFQLVTSGLDGTADGGGRWPTGLAAWTLLTLSLVVAGLLLKVLLAFGPLFAGQDRVFWIVSSPVARSALLLPRLLVLLGLGALLGAAWAAVVLGIVGADGLSAGPFAAGAAAGCALVGFSVVLQQVLVRPQRAQPWLSALVLLAALALLVGLVDPATARALRTPLRHLDPDLALAGAVVLAVAAVLGALGALRRVGRAALSAGFALASAVAVSVSWLELGLLGAILVERRARARGRVRSARLRGPALRLLVWTDVLRVLRARNAVLVWVALLPLPLLAGLAGGTTLVPGVHLVAAFLATDRLAGGLKFVCRSPAMRRVLGLPVAELRLAHLVLPAVGALSWCAVSVPITPGVSLLNGVVSAVGSVAVVYRIATRPPIDFNVATVDFGAFGPTPVGLIIQLSRGPALLLALAALQVVLL